jgi:hypothetical protein
MEIKTYEQLRRERIDEAREWGNLYRKLSLQTALENRRDRYEQFDCRLTMREEELLYAKEIGKSLR